MEKVKKTAKLFLCISLALMLLCGIVVSAVQTSGGDVVMKELNIETDSGYTMSAYLLSVVGVLIALTALQASRVFQPGK